jgi:hypothetical protein
MKRVSVNECKDCEPTEDFSPQLEVGEIGEIGEIGSQKKTTVHSIIR